MKKTRSGRANSNFVHGFSSFTKGTPERKFYNIWWHIKDRCGNKKYQGYKNYGGRGIRCEWTSFDEFKQDMFKSFLKHNAKHGGIQTSIERTDNNGNYSKENCRWATKAEQAKNQRPQSVPYLKGQEHGASKLTDEKVLKIRALQGKRSAKEIAKMFDINNDYVYAIWKKRAWKHL